LTDDSPLLGLTGLQADKKVEVQPTTAKKNLREFNDINTPPTIHGGIGSEQHLLEELL
jgi:hypothetical protein